MLKKYESLANKNYNDNNITKLNLDKPSIEDSIKLTDQTRKALEEKITGKIKSSGVTKLKIFFKRIPNIFFIRIFIPLSFKTYRKIFRC